MAVLRIKTAKIVGFDQILAFVTPLIAETIQRIAKGESVMSLFSDQDQPVLI